MDIMDMTLRQILQAAEVHPVKDMVIVVMADNILAGACGAAGWTKGETFFLQASKFIGAILTALGKKIPPVTPKTGQSILNFLLLIVCIFFIGCSVLYQGNTQAVLKGVSASGYGTANEIDINRQTNFEFGENDAGNR